MKLEDIPKKHNFTVPDGYFNSLPGKIQQRIPSEREPEMSFVIRYKLQYIAPILIAAACLFWLMPGSNENDADSILASVEAEDMIAYLEMSELTTEEVMEESDFDNSDIEEIEMEIYQPRMEDELFDPSIEQEAELY